MKSISLQIIARGSVSAQLLQVAEAIGWRCYLFETEDEFLHDYKPQPFECILVDLQVGAESLLHEIRARSWLVPAIALGLLPSISRTIDVLRAGANWFLESPIDHRALQATVERLVDAHASNHPEFHEQVKRMVSLSVRERQIFDRLLLANSTKQIAKEFAISTSSVGKYRSRILTKMKAGSVPELILQWLDTTYLWCQVTTGVKPPFISQLRCANRS